MNETLSKAKMEYKNWLAQKIIDLAWDADGNLGDINNILVMSLDEILNSLLQNGIGLCVVSDLLSDKGNDRSAMAAVGKIHNIVHILKRRK